MDSRPGRSMGDDELRRALAVRPGSGPEPTDQDAYYDSGSGYGALDRDQADVPWSDNSDAREDEL